MLRPQDATSIELIENLVLFATSFALGRSARTRRAALQEVRSMPVRSEMDPVDVTPAPAR